MSNNPDILREALDAYYEHFGRNYPLVVSCSYSSDEELAAAVRKCIEDDTPAPEPVYRDGCLY